MVGDDRSALGLNTRVKYYKGDQREKWRDVCKAVEIQEETDGMKRTLRSVGVGPSE